MADSHGEQDPNVAPMHLDVRFDFREWEVFVLGLLGTVAIAAGIVFGILLAND